MTSRDHPQPSGHGVLRLQSEDERGEDMNERARWASEACLRKSDFRAFTCVYYLIMILIVGLGNPGKKFQKTRHNLGFLILDYFQKSNKFPSFKFKKKFIAEISQGKINKQKIIFAKSQTFMNNSGQAVKKLVSSIKYKVSDLWVVHDDIDLPLGKIKISKSRGAGGHKGVESIIKEIRTKNFVRFRIGIKSATSNQKPLTSNKNIEKFVLQKFSKKEEKTLKEVIKKTSQAIKTAITEGIEKAMNKFNC